MSKKKTKREAAFQEATDAVEAAKLACLRAGMFLTGGLIRQAKDLLNYEICQERLTTRLQKNYCLKCGGTIHTGHQRFCERNKK